MSLPWWIYVFWGNNKQVCFLIFSSTMVNHQWLPYPEMKERMRGREVWTSTESNSLASTVWTSLKRRIRKLDHAQGSGTMCWRVRDCVPHAVPSWAGLDKWRLGVIHDQVCGRRNSCPIRRRTRGLHMTRPLDYYDSRILVSSRSVYLEWHSFLFLPLFQSN